MLALFASAVQSADILPFDDTYYPGYVTKDSPVTYLVQGEKQATILLVYNASIEQNLITEKKINGENDFTDFKVNGTDRASTYKTRMLDHPTADNYFYLRVRCTADEPCEYTIRNVHTQPVFRVSAVLGAFSLFICLFLLVFSWTIFCGACRATRKR